jgi:hypothetical protein
MGPKHTRPSDPSPPPFVVYSRHLWDGGQGFEAMMTVPPPDLA